MRSSFCRFVMITCSVVPLALGTLTVASCSKPAPNAATKPAAAADSAPGAAGATAAPAKAAAPGKPVPPAPPPPRTFTLAAGTVLTVQTNYTLSTDAQAAGDKFLASLADPVVSGDWVVAKAGAEVDGLVVAATKGGRVKGRAELEVAIVGLTLSDGQRIPVVTAIDTTQAASTKDKDAKTIAVTAGVGAVVGAIAGGGKGAAIGAAAGGGGGTALVLGTRGKAAEIPARSILRFTVTNPVEIVEKK
jgi:hypothetical protein